MRAKIGVLYDYLQVNGGAEQVALNMARQISNAELLVSSINPNNFDLASTEFMDVLALQEFSSLSPVRIMKTIYAFKHRKEFINKYETMIYSGFYAPLAMTKRNKGKNIYYCHTPPRYLFDLNDYYSSKLGRVGSLFLQAFCQWYRPQYERAVGQMDVVIANSKNVQGRLKDYMDIESTVIHPPVEVDKFDFLGQEDYYISLARLEPYKQVDKIIEAFKLMPDKRLVITSGGSDYNRLKKLADSANNIHFTGWIDDAELVSLLGNAIASIYIAKDEDFGMSPVESQASGKPVIGVADGGLLETVRHQETGILVNKELTNSSLIEAIEWMTPKKARSLKGRCMDNAQQFRTERFLQQISTLL